MAGFHDEKPTPTAAERVAAALAGAVERPKLDPAMGPNRLTVDEAGEQEKVRQTVTTVAQKAAFAGEGAVLDELRSTLPGFLSEHGMSDLEERLSRVLAQAEAQYRERFGNR